MVSSTIDSQKMAKRICWRLYRTGLIVDPLDLAPQGVIWAGFNVDYPGHSFSHLGLFYGESLFYRPLQRL